MTLWTFEHAEAAGQEASRQQKAAEVEVRRAYGAAAEAEKAYRLALARKITEFRAEGMAATLCADLARGDEHVARLRMARDVAEGVREAAQQAGWRLNSDRKSIESLTAWARGVALRTDDVADDRLAWSGRQAA